MKLLSPIILVSLASLASTATIRLEKREYPLKVQLQRVSNSEVNIHVINDGLENLKLLNRGTLLDSLATEKLRVFSKG